LFPSRKAILMAKKKTRKMSASGRKKTRRKAAGRRKTRSARSSPLSSLATAELERELGRRQGQVRTLERRRDRIAEQLSEVEAELAKLGALGGVTVNGVRKRPRNDANLADSLVKALKNKTMSVTEAADAVRKAGYRTSADNFRTIVNQTLIKDKRIKRVSRGQYTAK
jgi:hypothetical protein